MSARMVRTVKELRALDMGALVRDSANVVFEKWASGWYPAGPFDEPETPSLPATILTEAIDPDDEALVEKVARALCEGDANDPDKIAPIGIPFWHCYADQARAALKAVTQ